MRNLHRRFATPLTILGDGGSKAKHRYCFALEIDEIGDEKCLVEGQIILTSESLISRHYGLPIFCMKSTKALPLLMQKVPSLRLFLDCILDFLMEAIVEGRLLFDGETRAREGGMVIFRCSFITIGSRLSLFGQKYC